MKINDKKLNIKSQSISDIKIIAHNIKEDERGYFERMFCDNELSKIFKDKKIVQINRTRTLKKGTIRGMHFQVYPYQELKIVQCISGRILDIVIDIRSKSPTYMQYCEVELSEKNNEGLLVPEGFAHGFQTLEDNVDLIYFHSNFYNPGYEKGLNPLDNYFNFAVAHLL